MEVLVYYILFISAAIIIVSCVNTKKGPGANEKLLDNMNKLKSKDNEDKTSCSRTNGRRTAMGKR
jgi:hypothetical protein